jgi:hypothetical protein
MAVEKNILNSIDVEIIIVYIISVLLDKKL